MNKNLTLTTVDQFTIAANHTISRGKGVILWLHGIATDMDEYQQFFKDGAEFLSSAGLDSLRIDFRGHGDSSGSSLDFSVVGQMLDVGAAFDYILKYYNQKIGIVIVGCSFGAPPAIFAAQRYADLITSVILIAPVLSYERTFLKPETNWAKSIFNSRTFLKLGKTNRLLFDRKFPIGSRLVEEMRIIKPDDALRILKKKTSIIHGDVDSMVPFQISEEFVKNNPTTKLIPFSGMDHGFMDAEDESGKSQRSIENKLCIYKIIQDQFL